MTDDCRAGRPTRVYLAGGMRGYPEFNFPAFHKATAQLRLLGYEVFSPAEQDVNNGFDPTGLTGKEISPAGFNVREALAMDLNYVCRHADAVVTLPAWEYSPGARAEVAAARAVGIQVWSLSWVLETEMMVMA